jgi:hypothetical protein
MSERATVDVAFELARSGRYRSIEELRRALAKAGCDKVSGHMSSASLKKQLIQLMDEAQR